MPTLVEFFGARPRRAGSPTRAGRPSLVLGNNVLAQVPDLNDFVAGVQVLLRDGGTATFEFPHLATLVEQLEYDTIYHEHFSYFSLSRSGEIFGAQGLDVVDVEELPTHGGSLRVYFAPRQGGPRRADRAVADAPRPRGRRRDCATPERTARFAEGVKESKRALLDAPDRLRGTPGSRSSATARPGRATRSSTTAGSARTSSTTRSTGTPTSRASTRPGTHIPIHPPERIAETRPDLILILPWNLADEISAQLAYTAEWGAKLIVPIPLATVIDPGDGAVSAWRRWGA